MDRRYLRNVVNIVLFLMGVVLVCLLVSAVSDLFHALCGGMDYRIDRESPGTVHGKTV